MVFGGGSLATLTAFNRFGLGARPGDFAAAGSDPRGFLIEELNKPDAVQVPNMHLTGREALVQLFEEQEERRAQASRSMPVPPKDMLGISRRRIFDEPGSGAIVSPGAKPDITPRIAQRIYRDEVLSRLRMQATASAGLMERLVTFWVNHFAIAVTKGEFVYVSAGAFEREAIRPHVLGRFADMLKAVEQHPAMLFYLDNQRSMGPASQAGDMRGKGLNENLAREILELHTLGVDGGYAQADVMSLANILTGWTFVGREGEGGDPGSFIFRPQWHQPGTQKLLAKHYPEDGLAQGEAALADLARHPATAMHLTTKLVRHFLADDPPAPLVERLSKTFRDTEGDLAAVSRGLLQDDDAWAAPPAKVRSPSEFVAAMIRATGVVPNDPLPFIGALAALGMLPWNPPGPNGFPDTASVWASPEAMKVRLDVSWRAAQQFNNGGQPIELLDEVTGTAHSRETREAVARAESRQQAMAILFMSPEFQRR